MSGAGGADMTRTLRLVSLVVLSSALPHAVLGQISTTEPSKDAAPQQWQPTDPLERSTPRDAMTAFIRAVDRGDFIAAERYMQAADAQRSNTEELARDLKALMDRYFTRPLTSISDAPDGALDDGLPIDRERVGPLLIGGRSIDVGLVRVTDPQAGPIWLISSETLAGIPALRDSAAKGWIERTMPPALVSREIFGVTVAHWIVFAASLLVPFALLTLIAGALVVLATRLISDPTRRRDLEAWFTGIRWPAIVALTLAVQLTSIPRLGFPLTFRIAYAHVGLLATVIAFAWLLRRLATLAFAHARSMAQGRHLTSTRSLMLLGERLVKALVVVAAVVSILMILGVESRTALAAFGIVGVALALGAQRTVENLLGGVFMLSDRAIAIGDLCRITDRLGWIEDITLRSVRLRTLDNSLVSVPAGVLAQEGIENFATREKILTQSILRLRHGTSVEQLKRILDSVRKLLDEHPMIERGSSRIRLVNFAPEAIELELFAYVQTADIPEFLAVREDLLLRIADVIEETGSSFAAPTQFIYLNGAAESDAHAHAPPARDAKPSDLRSLPDAHLDGEALAASR